MDNKSTIQILQDKLNQLIDDFHRIAEEQKSREVAISSIKNTMQVLQNPTAVILKTENGKETIEEKTFYYPKDTTWKEKIIQYIKFKNKAVTTSNIVDAVLKVEPLLLEKQVMNLISGNMSVLVKEGHIKPYKPKKMKGFYYANPLWFDENGELLEAHKPNMVEVSFW